jgi:RNA polymerase sigma-70 factor (ECF subfamily)
MDDPRSDETLMLAYRDGDPDAFEVLYRRHQAPLYRYFLRQCGARALAEELYQDVWLNLIRVRQHYAVRAKFTTYLYHLAHNRLIDHYRSKKRLPLSYEDDPVDPILERLVADPRHEPETGLTRARAIERVQEILAALPEAQREAFLLREEAGLSVEEIAATTGVNPEAAKSRLRYALAKLRDGLEGYAED